MLGGVGPLTSQDGDRIDPEDIAAWYREYAGPLRSFLLGVVRNAELAEEILQVTFTRAMEAGHTARDGTQKGWLFRVAYNEAMLFGRKRQLHDRSLRQIARQPLPETETPEARAGLLESAERVRDALERAVSALQGPKIEAIIASCTPKETNSEPCSEGCQKYHLWSGDLSARRRHPDAHASVRRNGGDD